MCTTSSFCAVLERRQQAHTSNSKGLKIGLTFGKPSLTLPPDLTMMRGLLFQRFLIWLLVRPGSSPAIFVQRLPSLVYASNSTLSSSGSNFLFWKASVRGSGRGSDLVRDQQ